MSYLDGLKAMRENIERFRAEQEAKLASDAHESEDLPPPPHPDERWVYRGRKVFARMLSRGYEHAPWHHAEIRMYYETPAGRPWLEREIVFWEMHMHKDDLAVIETRKRKPFLDPEDVAEAKKPDDWDYLDGDLDPFTDRLRRREYAEHGMTGRAVKWGAKPFEKKPRGKKKS